MHRERYCIMQSKMLIMSAALSTVGSIAVHSQPRPPANAVLYEGARLIIGDGSAPVERGSFAVQNGRIVAIGRQGAFRVPDGAARVDLTGKTVMPALVNVHVHIGYEGYTTWRPENYTPQNILDHLERQAYFGVGATMSVGGDPPDQAIQFQAAQAAGKFALASRFFFAPGVVPPGGGPDPILIKGTTALHAVYEVTTDTQARAAVQTIAGKRIKDLKIWVDDRRGTYPKMPPEVYNAVIDEAHKRQIRVHAHALTLADQKSVVRAGADVLVHTVANEKVDDELLGLLKEKRPYWTPVMGFGDRSPLCANDPFIEQVLPEETIDSVRKSCGQTSPNAAAREDTLRYNFPKMIAAGARLVLGTDAGVLPRYSFGWADHHEIERYVELGLTPSQALVASTLRSAELLSIKDMGTLAPGKSADFIVLNANPLESIRNLRQIEKVYLRGVMVDRDALLAGWKKERGTH
jgi:imidazolonepropionase-like amidohydrolase